MAGGKRSGDNNTSKDGVVIQRVIHEVGDGSSYPALTKTNCSDWVLLMKVKLKAWLSRALLRTAAPINRRR
jgi:hypothetical protein